MSAPWQPKAQLVGLRAKLPGQLVTRSHMLLEPLSCLFLWGRQVGREPITHCRFCTACAVLKKERSCTGFTVVTATEIFCERSHMCTLRCDQKWCCIKHLYEKTLCPLNLNICSMNSRQGKLQSRWFGWIKGSMVSKVRMILVSMVALMVKNTTPLSKTQHFRKQNILQINDLIDQCCVFWNVAFWPMGPP